MSELSALADFIVNLKAGDLPESVWEAAVLHVLDTVGTAIGANSDAQVQSVCRAWLQKDCGGSAHLWGSGAAASMSTSVFLNSMMGHTQEMDDVHTGSKTHIGTVVIPAAWSAAEELGCSGEEFLLAVVCGYEVMSRIGMGFGVSAHRNKGWHVTATAGTFGAAAAVGKLLKLDRAQMINALALAGAQSFGTWAFLGDGASCKALNPARAAQSGTEAAFLAKAGMTGPEHVLTAEDGGLLNSMTDQPQTSLITEGLGSTWQILFVDNKPYPSCRSTHCAIDAALEIRCRYAPDPAEITHIDLETYLVGYKQCAVSEGSCHPETPVHAKFSTPFTVACALLCGELSLDSLNTELIQSDAMQELLHKVTVHPSEEFTGVYPAHWGCRMRVEMRDGRILESYVRDASGSVAKPLTRLQVKEKAKNLMRGVVPEHAAQISDAILNIGFSRRLPVLA